MYSFFLKRRRLIKSIGIFFAFNILLEAITPITLYALTGGPSQPEVQSFEPIGTSEMVDLFTGDFTYNIPLLDVGGYPINIAYHSGITTDQEASWVGLGWNINPGALTRNMRGLPDDFKGNADAVEKEFNMKENNTYGGKLGGSIELFGLDKFKIGASIAAGFCMYYNTYKGVGFELSVSPQASIASKNGGQLTAGLGLSASGESGVGLTPSLSYSASIRNADKSVSPYTLGASVSSSFNSREGLKALSFSTSLGYRVENATKNGKAISGQLGSVNSSFSLGTPTYVPSISMSMKNSGSTFNGTVGGEIFGVHGNVRLTGYYSKQELARKKESLPSYGYLYADAAMNDPMALYDFNREKDIPFSEHTPVLPITNFTYDIYSAAGQGVSGSFRPFRGDAGIISDNLQTNVSNNSSFGAEIGGGNAVHGGGSVELVNTNASSGKWQLGQLDTKLGFQSKTAVGTPLYEPYYFKQAGEKNADADPTFWASIGDDKAVRVALGQVGEVVNAKNFFTTGSDDGEVYNTINGSLYRKNRQNVNQHFSFLNADEASKFALETNINNYEGAVLSSSGYVPVPLSRIGGNKKTHHISEVAVVNPDGNRYIYGIPAYNTRQDEVTFAIADKTGGISETLQCDIGLVSYNPSADNSLNNPRGRDNFYSKTSLKPYAHSYLLTAVVSPDYVDFDGIEGPSPGDLGTYTKFNYALKVTNYKWRVPYDDASYSEGLKADEYDDKASYVYGEKELWYLHSIETKNYIAEFVTSARNDGKSVVDENGGIGVGNMYQLDKINLYSRSDRFTNLSNAIPIKTVHFQYDYSLGQGVPNSSSGGKLTLKKLFFTYGSSNKGKLNSYKFHYANAAFKYNLKAYDRWGSFKPNAGTDDHSGSTFDPCNIIELENPDNALPNYDYPYVEQDSVKAAMFTSAWSLNRIELPSGGEINIQYESDDYAYVQDKRAMQMFNIVGAGPSPVFATNGQLYNGNINHNYLFFEIQDPINDDIQDYFNGIDKLYFRFLVEVGKANSNKYEFVPGYAEIDQFGIASGNSNYGYVKIKEVHVKDGSSCSSPDCVNPVSKAAWNYLKTSLPRIAYNLPDPSGTKVKDVLQAITASFGAIKDFIKGANERLRADGYAQSFIPNKGWIRLNNPNGKKLGGGVRVKQISIADNWAGNIAGSNNGSDFQYGQEYDYTTIDPVTGKIISSGVAAYEPLLGGDENPFRQPIDYKIDRLLVPDEEHYVEEPMGESFFPAPVVGYGKIKVQNIQYPDVKRTATGYVIHEFYTAKDFPTITKRTTFKPLRYKEKPLFSLLRTRSKDYMTASQGYAIELNDMHGKPKAQWVYAEGQLEAISGVRYLYKTDPSNSKKLNNEVRVIDEDGNIDDLNVGVDYDFINDARRQFTSTKGGGVNINVDAFLAAIIPIVIPIVLPSSFEENVRFQSLVSTKVINRFGILEKTEAYDLGSRVTTENRLYDAVTGEVLSTRTQNDFNDPVYSLNYPAHWAYAGMEPISKNIGVEFSMLNVVDGEFTVPDNMPSKYFYRGDELLINNKKAWVYEIKPTNEVVVIGEDGVYINEASAKIKVLRSGRRNQQVTPIGSITSLKDPVSGATIVLDSLLNANAVQFTDTWNMKCYCGFNPGDIVNPYKTGVYGNWRAKKSWLYLTDRMQSAGNTYIREDGAFNNFNPFWDAPVMAGDDWTQDTVNWTSTSSVTILGANGFELENVDALGRYSGALYGYNDNLPVSVSSNARYTEIANDNFEDYPLKPCLTGHFDFNESNLLLKLSNKSHTGRNSIKVESNSSISVTRKLECEE